VGVWLLTEASSFFLSVSSSSLILLADARRPRIAGHQRSVISTGLLGQIQILIYLQACIPGVCILGVGPYLVGGPGRPPRLPASRAGPGSGTYHRRWTRYSHHVRTGAGEGVGTSVKPQAAEEG